MAETLRVAEAPDVGALSSVQLGAGESVATWVEGEARVANPGVGPGPVGDAPAGDVIARFETGRWFAWADAPLVWTAPRAGRLSLAINGGPAHGIAGAAAVVLIRLGEDGSENRRAFRPPTIAIDRVGSDIRARYVDEGGFGLDPKSLRFTLTTAHGGVYHLGPWAPVGERETVLPLPPPDVPLPAGIHRLSATITDRIGNDAPPATLLFDALQ